MRAFLRDFRAVLAATLRYWSGPEVARRLDDFSHNLRERLGSDPDPKVEARREERARGQR